MTPWQKSAVRTFHKSEAAFNTAGTIVQDTDKTSKESFFIVQKHKVEIFDFFNFRQVT